MRRVGIGCGGGGGGVHRSGGTQKHRGVDRGQTRASLGTLFALISGLH